MMPFARAPFRLVLFVFLVLAAPVFGVPDQALIPASEIEELSTAFAASQKEESSTARQRLAVKRVIRDAGNLLETHEDASNRFAVLGLLFQAQRVLFGLDDSPRNRAALLETAEALVKAPDAFARERIEADLLLTQTRLARDGADAKERLTALNQLVGRYRNTPGDATMLRTAMVMALELGDSRLVRDLRREMAERFAGDFEMINFQRDKLGGQVFGAPFCGLFQRSDGGTMHLPADGLGRTLFLYFWSQEDFGRQDLEALAAYWKEHREEIAGRVHIVSFNVDELPDAGEKILRDLGVDWPALHLPEGRENPRYEIFAKRDTALISMTPTGYSAIVMSGATRQRKGETAGVRDFDRWFQSLLAREWTRPRYTNQLTSLFAGDFLVTDAEGPFDPGRPPEIKALGAAGKDWEKPVSGVPAETLRAIQECWTLPPLRYRLSLDEIRSGYQKADGLCVEAIAAHPEAPDLWLVRNRRVVALLGLWKLSADPAYYDQAVTEARAALASSMPPGTAVIPRSLVAREELRQEGVDSKAIIENYLADLGGESAPGPAHAMAALLALEVADRALHEQYRALILERFRDDPMMSTFVSFLLDRHHRYWLYRVPFSAGWSYGRRSSVFMSLGDPDEAARSFEVELQTLEGQPYRLPQESEGKWTILLLTTFWGEDEKAPVDSTVGRYLKPHFETRAKDDVHIVVAVLDGEAAAIKRSLVEKPLDCEVVIVPGGLEHPMLRQFGVINEDQVCNALVVRPDGKVAIFLSGLTMSRARGDVIPNVIEWHDRQSVEEMLARGEVEEARSLILELAPPFDPEAIDEKGRKLKEPKMALPHLRARAQVYLAMEEWDKALADAEEVAAEQMKTEGWMSLRTNQLDEDEAFVDLIKKKRDEARK